MTCGAFPLLPAIPITTKKPSNYERLSDAFSVAEGEKTTVRFWLAQGGIALKLTIHISGYVDTIQVLLDGENVEIKKLTVLSKAVYICDVAPGVHELCFVKESELSAPSWKKNVAVDWLSCLFGVPDWSLREKTLDCQISSMTFKVNVTQDMRIKAKLTADGFMFAQETEAVFDVATQRETNDTAKKRMKKAYLLPAAMLAAVIGICLLVACVFLLVNGAYLQGVLVFAIAVFWAWLICGLYRENRKNKPGMCDGIGKM